MCPADCGSLRGLPEAALPGVVSGDTSCGMIARFLRHTSQGCRLTQTDTDLISGSDPAPGATTTLATNQLMDDT